MGEADYALDNGRPDEARRALLAAQDSMERHSRLRETVRGIHPQILSDRGLALPFGLAERQQTP